MPASNSTSSSSSIDSLMEAAVAAVGGAPRPGQQQMTEAVAKAFDDEHHLLVQAGTGTGKSLAYLVPSIVHANATGKPVIVATATLALQAQIVGRDLPVLAEALRPVLGRRPTYGLVKGRRNYLCQHKLVGGYPDDEEDSLFSTGAVDQQLGRLEKEIVRLREWAGETDTGDRDDLVPGVSERAWRQVSVTAHECLGSTCPMVQECFVEKARAEARDVDVVVTNHSFMAIDSFEGRQMLPEHDALVVDEAHELVDRVTSTITDELTAGMVASAAKKAARYADTQELADTGVFLGESSISWPRDVCSGCPTTWRSPSSACTTAHAACPPTSSPTSRPTTTAPDRWHGPRSTKCWRTPHACSKHVNSTSPGSAAASTAARHSMSHR